VTSGVLWGYSFPWLYWTLRVEYFAPSFTTPPLNYTYDAFVSRHTVGAPCDNLLVLHMQVPDMERMGFSEFHRHWAAERARGALVSANSLESDFAVAGSVCLC
jgi:hypothetical protein